MENTEIVEAATDSSVSNQEKVVLATGIVLIVAGVGLAVYRKLKKNRSAAEEEQLWTETEEAAQN